jgi:hypothetical protein
VEWLFLWQVFGKVLTPHSPGQTYVEIQLSFVNTPVNSLESPTGPLLAMVSFIIIIIIIYLFTCAYIVWVISLPFPAPPTSPIFPPQFQAGPVMPLSLALLKKTDKPNKEDKVVLLVELRIAIQKYS